MLESVEIPPQHLLHSHHHLLSVRKVHWLLFIPFYVLLPQWELEVPVLLVSPVEGVDPSGEVAAHVHVQQQLLPLLPVVLQPQQQLINPTHIFILLHGDATHQGLESVGQFHGVFIEGKHDEIKK